MAGVSVLSWAALRAAATGAHWADQLVHWMEFSMVARTVDWMVHNWVVLMVVLMVGVWALCWVCRRADSSGSRSV